MPDTEPLPTHNTIRVAQLEFGLVQLGRDMVELKDDNKRIFESLGEIRNTSTQVNGLLNLINVNQVRADKRWDELQENRKSDLHDWWAWRKDLDRQLHTNIGMIRTLKWIVGLVGGAVVAGALAWIKDMMP